MVVEKVTDASCLSGRSALVSGTAGIWQDRRCQLGLARVGWKLNNPAEWTAE